MEENSQRAKARWSILRNAILHQKAQQKTISSCNSSSTNSNTNVVYNEHEKYSIHRFKGFNLLHRKLLEGEHIPSYLDYLVKDDDHNDTEYEIIEYDLPMPSIYDTTNIDNDHMENKYCHDDNQGLIKFRTREKKQSNPLLGNKINIKDLMSHVHYGVDNTGNTRVWECSSVLAHLLSCTKERINVPILGVSNIISLSRSIQRKNHDNNNDVTAIKRLRVIELGSGMAALPSLMLAASALANTNEEAKDEIPFMDIFITDGHPQSIANNSICSRLTFDLYNGITTKLDTTPTIMTNDILYNDKCSLRTRQLLWKSDEEGKMECQALLQQGSMDGNEDYFDVALVSDCTHFTDFHAALVSTIGRLLRIGGVCFLCQPKRGKSLDLFIKLIHSVNKSSGVHHLFDLDLNHDVSTIITEQHDTMLSNGTDIHEYDPNIHRPLLLTLKKLRPFQDADADMAIKTLEQRK